MDILPLTYFLSVYTLPSGGLENPKWLKVETDSAIMMEM